MYSTHTLTKFTGKFKIYRSVLVTTLQLLASYLCRFKYNSQVLQNDNLLLGLYLLRVIVIIMSPDFSSLFFSVRVDLVIAFYVVHPSFWWTNLCSCLCCLPTVSIHGLVSSIVFFYSTWLASTFYKHTAHLMQSYRSLRMLTTQRAAYPETYR